MRRPGELATVPSPRTRKRGRTFAALSEATTLRIGYRLQGAQDLEFSGGNDLARVNATTSMRVHFLELGIRHRF